MGWLLLGSAGDKAGKVGGVAWGVSGVRRKFPGARGEVYMLSNLRNSAIRGITDLLVAILLPYSVPGTRSNHIKLAVALAPQVRCNVHCASATFFPPPLSGGLNLNSSSSGCARLSSGVAPPLPGWLKKKWPS